MRVRSFFNIKAGGVGISIKPEDQTKNSFSNRQIVNTLPFSAFFTKNDNANKIDPLSTPYLTPYPDKAKGDAADTKSA